MDMKQVEINGLLWDTENLEIDGKKYFTWKEAMEAAKSVGKRLPTKDEFDALIQTGWEYSKADKGIWFANEKLFFPACGYQYYSSGSLDTQDSTVRVWSSTPDGLSSAHFLIGNWGDAYVYSSYYRFIGYAVRCVQDISDNSTSKENNMEKIYSQWKSASCEPPEDMQIVFVKAKSKNLLAGLGVGYKLPGRMAFEVGDDIISYEDEYSDVLWTEVPK